MTGELHPLEWRHGTDFILGQRQSVLVAGALGARAQGACVRIAALAVRQAGASIAADAENESARPRPSLEGRRLRGVRVGRYPLLLGFEVPASADIRTDAGGIRRHHARDLRVSGLRRTLAAKNRRSHFFRSSCRRHRQFDRCHARRGPRSAHDRGAPEQGRMDRGRELHGFGHGDFPLDPAIAPGARSQRSRRIGRALPSHGTQLPRPGALDSPYRVASRVRSYLSAPLARRL